MSALTPLQAKQLEIAALLERGRIEDSRLLFDSIKDQCSEASRFSRFIDLLSHQKASPDWGKRAQEIGGVFRQYALMTNPISLQRLAISATKKGYNNFHYSVIFYMQMRLLEDLFKDEKHYRFLDKELLPAFHTYFKSGCLKKLIEALSTIKKEKGLFYVELFLNILTDYPYDLRRPIGFFLPEKELSYCIDVSAIQNRLVKTLLPYLKKIYLELDNSRERENSVSYDSSIMGAKLDKILSKVSPEFAVWFREYYNGTLAKLASHLKFISIAEKFTKEDPKTTFGKFSSQVKFSISLAEQLLKDQIFFRDLTLFSFTCDMRKLEREWECRTTDGLFKKYIKTQVGKISEKWEARKPSAFLGQWAVIAAADPNFRSFYQMERSSYQECNSIIRLFSGLFTLAIETGHNLKIKGNFAGSVVIKDENKKDLDPPKQITSTPRLPSSLSLAPVSVVESVFPTTDSFSDRKSPVIPSRQSPRQSLSDFLGKVFTPMMSSFGNEAAEISFKNGRRHIENFLALLERLRRSPQNIFPTFALMGATLATALENLLKSYLYAQKIPFEKSSHNLLMLCKDIPFIELTDIVDIRSVNFAERNIRCILDTSSRGWQTSFERDLTEVQKTPTLITNIERIGRLFRRTFPLLSRFFNGGTPKEIDLEETVQRTLDMVQEAGTFVEMPSPHPELAARLETLIKRFGEFPVTDGNRRKLSNLIHNLSCRLRDEISLSPTPQGMQVHYGTLFRFLPLITEELIKLLFIKAGVKKSPFAFKHDLLQMLKEAKMDVSKPLQEFLARIPEYARMQRYPARAKYKDRFVKYVSDLIGRVQGNFPNPIDKGFKPTKGSPDEAFQELEKALHNEYMLLDEFTKLMQAAL